MNDALDRIRQRQRPKVTPRDASLTSQPPDIQTSRHIDVQERKEPGLAEFPDIQTSRHTDDLGIQKSGHTSIPDIQTSRHTDSLDIQKPESVSPPDRQTQSESNLKSHSTIATDNPDVETSRHTDIQTSLHQDLELQTKRSTFRLEAELIERLHTFCRRRGLSREVLIEAMFEYMEAHPEALDEVVSQASQKHEYRQQIANRKRAEAMMSKFGG